jgi:hypothetical protein
MYHVPQYEVLIIYYSPRARRNAAKRMSKSIISWSQERRRGAKTFPGFRVLFAKTTILSSKLILIFSGVERDSSQTGVSLVA